MPLSAPRAGWEPLIRQVLAEIARVSEFSGRLTVGRRHTGALARLLDLAVAWNQRVDLTAARGPDELVDLFVADAALLAASAGAGADEGPPVRWVDVGSGAGAPGLVLALLAPGLRLTLVEPRSKRVAFLRSALGSLGLGRVEVERKRSEELEPGRWGVASSRAALPPAEWLREGSRLATGAVWVLLGRAEPPSLAGWSVDRDVSYRWPLTGAERRAVRFVPDPPGPNATGDTDGG
jgi:16S rRNA (guanine527-N7)-methyltransferase